jgi:GDP-L-fucose synthase
MATASLHVMQLPKALYDRHTQPMQSHINVGSGSDVTVADLAHHIANTIGYIGQIKFDDSKPDGAPRKWIDSARLNALGWKPRINLQQGLAAAYQDFVNNKALKL